ncbi:hypothetical protein PT974_09858 [Cladobotryum mycophilum]|uniref:Uncharacterized protein n=1 Tax=Cladobotryum mycophilum TaxID=491253 RepID=A0ABR0SHD6_9HYPO
MHKNIDANRIAVERTFNNEIPSELRRTRVVAFPDVGYCAIRNSIYIWTLINDELVMMRKLEAVNQAVAAWLTSGETEGAASQRREGHSIDSCTVLPLSKATRCAKKLSPYL